MRYEANLGQHDSQARYVARQGALTLFATAEGPVLGLRVPEAVVDEATPTDDVGPTHRALMHVRPSEAGPSEAGPPAEAPPSRVHGLWLRLEGARSDAPLEASEELITRSNYFLGDDPRVWRTNIPNYAALRYRELAPGVDLVLRGSAEGRIEYDFVVAPGTDPELVVHFEGAERVSLGEDGALEVHLGGVVLEQPAPVLYQEIGGRRVPVEGAYRIAGDDGVRFEVGAYDLQRPLVIDPVLVYGTYLGGSSTDRGRSIAVDGAGAAYVVGSTESATFPTANAYQSGRAGTFDAFVAKLTPSGNALAYATYLGGTSDETGLSIAVDGTGAAYVTGYTSSWNFPTASPYQAAHAGVQDAFVAKLSAGGDALVYSTLLGGADVDHAYSITVDGAGAAYISGHTRSVNFPTANPYQGARSSISGDAFVAKLSAAGTALVYATYLGGSGVDYGYSLAVDGVGAAYVTGLTWSADFPAANPYQGANAGSGDAFVAKLSPAGDGLVYATYLGGSSSDYARFIAVDGVGAAYVTGDTQSANFPMAGAYQGAIAGGYDAFVAKLSAGGDALVYATYLGGSAEDFGYSIAVDGAGAASVAGYTASTDFPTADAHQTTNAGGNDVFVTRLSATGDTLEYATYLGGESDDRGYAIAVDSFGAAYVAGFTESTSFPTARPYQGARAGGADAFVVKLADLAFPGASCAAAAQCASGFCVDGVCCGTACGGGAADCHACSVAAGAPVDGTCAPITGTACDDGRACTAGDVCTSGACAGTSLCDALTGCEEAGGTYVCGACPAGTFSANGTGVTSCAPCADGTWSSAGSTACSAWTDCLAGTFVSAAGTSTADRGCTVCLAGSYSTSSNAASCTSWSDCAAGQYETAAPASTRDRVCATLTTCTANEYESVPPTPTTDRVCATLTVCAEGEYESASATATSDRECAPCTECAAGEVEVRACTPLADSICEEADAGLAPDAGVREDASTTDADAGIRADAGDPTAAAGGCGCAVPRRGKAPSGLVLVGLAMLARVRWRRRRG